MTPILFNALLGVLPALVLGASIAAGTDDDRRHRNVFWFVYALWSFSLAMWNWMRGYSNAWLGVWLVVGVVALAVSRRRT